MFPLLPVLLLQQVLLHVVAGTFLSLRHRLLLAGHYFITHFTKLLSSLDCVFYNTFIAI